MCNFLTRQKKFKHELLKKIYVEETSLVLFSFLSELNCATLFRAIKKIVVKIAKILSDKHELKQWNKDS
jgi:hypothetical protein